MTHIQHSFVPYAREAVLAAEAFTEAVASQGAALSGMLRLGLIPTLAPYLAPVILDGLGRELPRLQPELREMMTDDVLDMLNRGRLDAAVIAINVNLRRTAVVPMYDEPLVVLISADHPWAGRDDVSLAELDDQGC